MARMELTRAGSPRPAPQVLIFGDSNRDGKVDEADIAQRDSWSWQGPGAFFLANVDDDNRDGVPDCVDLSINGSRDEADLAPLRVRLDPAIIQAGHQVQVTANVAGVRLYERSPEGWSLVEGPLKNLAPEMDLAVEGSAFANKDWNGRARLEVQVQGPQGETLARDQAQMRVAPLILLPNTAPTRELYVSSGHPNYENTQFRQQLAEASQQAGVHLVTHQTASWKEMWMQDTMEVGYTQLPGRAPQHVVLGGLRQADSFGPSLLGPERGFIQVGEFRGIEDGVDDWADWLGNLETTPPLPDYPLGRIFYGKNTDTGTTLHPELVSFLEAQEVQAPFWMDTGFLTIKHVDEIINFLPGTDGQPRMLLADTRSASQLAPESDGPSNARVQQRLDKILHGGSYASGDSTPGLLAQLGISPEQVVKLPVSYDGGHNIWSNPVNSIYLNGLAVTGDHHVPPAVAEEIQSQLLAAGAQEVRFVDDNRYQDNYGNVHCATNTLKEPVVADFSKSLMAHPA